MPIFSTSSLTDMPLVRLRELIMSSRCVRPISEIKRWFIRLKWLERNENAGLYTPRYLIRKCKIYPKANGKKRLQRTAPWRPDANSSYRKGEMAFCEKFREQIRSFPARSACGLPGHVAASSGCLI